MLQVRNSPIMHTSIQDRTVYRRSWRARVIANAFGTTEGTKRLVRQLYPPNHCGGAMHKENILRSGRGRMASGVRSERDRMNGCGVRISWLLNKPSIYGY